MEYRRYEEPVALRKIRAKMTYVDRIKTFQEVFDREPNDNDELEEFIEQYTLELYNECYDKGVGV